MIKTTYQLSPSSQWGLLINLCYGTYAMLWTVPQCTVTLSSIDSQCTLNKAFLLYRLLSTNAPRLTFSLSRHLVRYWGHIYSQRARVISLGSTRSSLTTLFLPDTIDPLVTPVSFRAEMPFDTVTLNDGNKVSRIPFPLSMGRSAKHFSALL